MQCLWWTGLLSGLVSAVFLYVLRWFYEDWRWLYEDWNGFLCSKNGLIVAAFISPLIMTMMCASGHGWKRIVRCKENELRSVIRTTQSEAESAFRSLYEQLSLHISQSSKENKPDNE